MSFLTKAVKSTSLRQALLNDLLSNPFHLKLHKMCVFLITKQHALLILFPNVILTFPALRLDNRAIRLYFFATLLLCLLVLMCFLVFHFTILEYRFTSLQWFTCSHWTFWPSCYYSFTHDTSFRALSYSLLPNCFITRSCYCCS